MKTETAVWQSLKRATENKVHWTRIEARVGSGIPDVNGCLPCPSLGQRGAIEFWVELKVCRTKAYKTAGLWRPAQIAWQTKRSAFSPHVYNLVSHPDASMMKIYDGSLAADLQFDASGLVEPLKTLRFPVPWSEFLDFVASRA